MELFDDALDTLFCLVPYAAACFAYVKDRHSGELRRTGEEDARLPPRRSGLDPRRIHSLIFALGIVLDDAVCRIWFSRGTPAFPALAFQRRSIIGSHFMSCPEMTGTFEECCLALGSHPTRVFFITDRRTSASVSGGREVHAFHVCRFRWNLLRDIVQQCRLGLSQETLVLSSIQRPFNDVGVNDLLSDDTTSDIDAPLALMFYLTNHHCLVDLGAAVAEPLACSPPTKANQVQSLAGSPDFRKRNRAGRPAATTTRFPTGVTRIVACGKVAGHFLGALPFSPPLHFTTAPFSRNSPSPAQWTKPLNTAQLTERCLPQSAVSLCSVLVCSVHALFFQVLKCSYPLPLIMSADESNDGEVVDVTVSGSRKKRKYGSLFEASKKLTDTTYETAEEANIETLKANATDLIEMKQLEDQFKSLHIEMELHKRQADSQNKNWTIIRFLHYVAVVLKRFDKVQVTYPIRGHSYMECDKNVALISQKTPAETPGDWREAIASARVKPIPSQVVKYQQRTLKQFNAVKHTTVLSSLHYLLRSKKKEVRLSKIKKPQRGQPPHLQEVELEQAYYELIPLSKEKFKDLESLKRFCRQEAQDYIDSLPALGLNDDNTQERDSRMGDHCVSGRTPYTYKEGKSCKETCIAAERDWAAMASDWGHDYLPDREVAGLWASMLKAHAPLRWNCHPCSCVGSLATRTATSTAVTSGRVLKLPAEGARNPGSCHGTYSIFALLCRRVDLYPRLEVRQQVVVLRRTSSRQRSGARDELRCPRLECATSPEATVGRRRRLRERLGVMAPPGLTPVSVRGPALPKLANPAKVSRERTIASGSIHTPPDFNCLPVDHRTRPYNMQGSLIGSVVTTKNIPPRRTGFDSRRGRPVFLGITRFPHRFIPALLHTHLTSPSSAPKTSLHSSTCSCLRPRSARGSDKGCATSRCKCVIATKSNALNWPNVLEMDETLVTREMFLEMSRGGAADSSPRSGVERVERGGRATVAERLARSPRRTGFNPRQGHRIFTCGNRAGRCRWLAGFLGDLLFPPLLHSDVAPYSLQSSSSALKTSLLRAALISSLFCVTIVNLFGICNYVFLSVRMQIHDSRFTRQFVIPPNGTCGKTSFLFNILVTKTT
ncbi:hypothetical protein PR048_010160 [Dryococelus australis]|uniref:Uncharacterized protein n=1 Tax=Dryococelus australis TaxID=614101 RepID=A0ABQ9I1Z4_9NEOP|nr:hypothetical protein PR048_010160 [Dryococelus australis]